MVANDGGDRVTPSVVSFTDQDEVRINLSCLDSLEIQFIFSCIF